MNGLIRKLSDPEFIGHINTYDIVVLSETWLSPKSNYNLNINGYEAFHLLMVTNHPTSEKDVTVAVYPFTINWS